MQGPKKRRTAHSGDGARSGDGTRGEDEPAKNAEGPGAEGPDTGGGERIILSRKELARELRRQAYQRAKRARSADPRQQALKEAAKQRRRELYQQVKARRKLFEAELAAKQKVAESTARGERQRQFGGRSKPTRAAESPPHSRAGMNEPARVEARWGEPSLEHNAFEVDSLEVASLEANSLDAVSFEAASFEAASFEPFAPAPTAAVRAGRARAEPARELAREIDRALQNGEVRELMARLARESAALAAQHRVLDGMTEGRAVAEGRTAAEGPAAESRGLAGGRDGAAHRGEDEIAP